MSPVSGRCMVLLRNEKCPIMYFARSITAKLSLASINEWTSRHSRLYDLIVVCLAIVFTFFIVAWVLKLQHANLNIPFVYSGDGLTNIMLVKGAIQHGWYLANPDLGAPHGQELYDLAIINGDNLHLIVIKMLSIVSSSAPLVINLFYLFSYAFIVLTSFFTMRHLKISPLVAAVCSVLFALLPYHFIRGESHLFLSSYYAVPISAYIILALYAGEPLIIHRRSRRYRNYRLLRFASKRSLMTVALCVVIGSTSAYYASFTIILLAVATVVSFAARRSRRTLITGAVLCMIIVSTLVINMAPSILYWAGHGLNPTVGVRQPSESEHYGLTITSLVMPPVEHRVGSLSQLGRSYWTTTLFPSEGMAYIGVVGIVGMIWLLGVALVSCVDGGRFKDKRIHRYTAASVITCLLLATVGGFSTLISYLISPELRAWNRISVFVAFFSLIGTALLLDALRFRILSIRIGQVVFPTLLAGILIVGVYDQTSSSYSIPSSALKAEFNNDKDFIRKIERRLSPGASIFQLPYLPFPESPPIVDLSDYDHLRPYVHSNRLRWSYGFVKGREGEWQDELVNMPISRMVPAITSVGFRGIYIDRFGYEDRAKDLESKLQNILGERPLVSKDKRSALFDLTPYYRMLKQVNPASKLRALRIATLKPITPIWDNGFWPEEVDGNRRWRWAMSRARLTLYNPSDNNRKVIIHGSIKNSASHPSKLVIKYPHGLTTRMKVSSSGVVFNRKIILSPGNNIITFWTDAPRVQTEADPRDMRIQFVNFKISDFAHADLTRRMSYEP